MNGIDGASGVLAQSPELGAADNKTSVTFHIHIRHYGNAPRQSQTKTV